MTLARSKPRPEDEVRELERAAYDRDFYTWTLQQAALIREGRFAEIDRENVAEEIEALGRSEFAQFVSFLQLILLHMLKWDHQPERRTRSWRLSIVLHRDHAKTVLDENPGFKSRLGEALARAYRRARLDAMKETKLPSSTFPEVCPYSLEETLERFFSTD